MNLTSLTVTPSLEPVREVISSATNGVNCTCGLFHSCSGSCNTIVSSDFTSLCIFLVFKLPAKIVCVQSIIVWPRSRNTHVGAGSTHARTPPPPHTHTHTHITHTHACACARTHARTHEACRIQNRTYLTADSFNGNNT